VLLNPPATRYVVRDNYCSFSTKARYLWPPIDLLIQSGWLAGEFQTAAIDAVVERLGPDACLDRLVRDRPDAVVLLTGAATFHEDAAFGARLRRSLPEARLIVILGRMVMEPDDYLRQQPWADAVLTDFSAPGVRDYLRGRRSTPGLLSRESTKTEPCTGSVRYPPPRHRLFPLERYRLPIGWRDAMSVMMTSLGCPHSCGFCTQATLPFRPRSLEDVADELAVLRRYGVENLFIEDSTFTADRGRAMELCSVLGTTRPELRWTCFGRVDQVDEELARAMAGAGCDLLQLGVESGDDAILARYRKGFCVDDARRAFQACRRAGIRTLGFFIIGLPGETEASVRKTIALAHELRPDFASFAIATPDPGTELRERWVASGAIDGRDPQVDSTTGPAIGSPRLGADQVTRWHQRARLGFYLRPGFVLGRLARMRGVEDLVRDVWDGLCVLR